MTIDQLTVFRADTVYRVHHVLVGGHPYVLSIEVRP